METYYKERQKQIKLYVKNIKKLAKNGASDELSALKKDYVTFMLRPPPFKREQMITESVYSEDMNRRIRETENDFITLKLDLCYDLYDGLRCDDFKTGLKDFDTYEKKLGILKKARSSFLSKKKDRELLEENTKKKQQETLNRIREDFANLDKEGKKTSYQEILSLSSVMANPRRQVIAYEIENKELEYRLVQLYDPPLYPLKISG